MAEPGREYRITVDGIAPPGGTPWMGDFAVFLSEDIPGPGRPGEPSSPASATVAPPSSSPPARPRMKGRSIDPRKGTATFHFRSATKAAKFRCAVDGKGYKACSSPFAAKGLNPRRQHATG
jgi:hypothetical protein